MAGTVQNLDPDATWLRRRPEDSSLSGGLEVADLFCGCGGMTLGLEEAARRSGLALEVRLAVDLDEASVAVYRDNFGEGVVRGDVAALFPGRPGEDVMPAEERLASEVGPIQVLAAGPPCQGHSDLNNHTRRNDPRNALYLRVARAAEVLGPDVVVIENVPPVQWDNDRVVEATSDMLGAMGYAVDGDVIDMSRVGIPQRRKRFILLASRLPAVNPTAVLTALPDEEAPVRDVRWAIGDIEDIESDDPLDRPSRMSETNARRAAYLFEHGLFELPDEQRPDCHRDGHHSYRSVYGRLRWDRPAQTVTTGFTSMGQGRYVHPARPRTITPHEAARLQTFPDWFRWAKAGGRGALARMIGNAVPPLMMTRLAERIVPHLVTQADDDRAQAS